MSIGSGALRSQAGPPIGWFGPWFRKGRAI